MKICTKCGKLKPINEFTNDKSTKNGKCCQCKDCRKISYSKRRIIYVQNLIENPCKLTEKCCLKCGEVKLMDEFTNDRLSKDGKSNICKQCNKVYNDSHKEKKKQHKRDNRKRYWSSITLRQHKAKGNIINVSTDFVEQLANNALLCPICKCKLDWIGGNGLNKCSPTLDRIDNENELREDNIWIICHKCNATKRDRTMQEFIDYCKMIIETFHN